MKPTERTPGTLVKFKSHGSSVGFPCFFEPITKTNLERSSMFWTDLSTVCTLLITPGRPDWAHASDRSEVCMIVINECVVWTFFAYLEPV